MGERLADVVRPGRDATAAVGERLATVEARRSAAATLAELNARTVCRLQRVTYNGGSIDSPLARDKNYDLRFLGDRLMVCPPGAATAALELPYHDVEAVEVSGSDRSRSPGETLAVILSVAVLGALLGLVVLGLLGLIIGGLVFGFIAAAAMSSSAKIKTIVWFRSHDAEFFFLNNEKTADAVRIELSGPGMAIERARTARSGGSGEPADRAPDSIPEQLSKLASLLADGVLSPEEFERLKASYRRRPSPRPSPLRATHSGTFGKTMGLWPLKPGPMKLVASGGRSTGSG